MRGYVENIGRVPIYIFKSFVGQGERIGFDKLLKRFNGVADTNSEVLFANWLSDNIFVNKEKWKIVTKKIKKSKLKKELKNVIDTVKDEETPIESNKKEQQEEVISKVTSTNKEIIKKVVTGVSREITFDMIANMSVSRIKKQLPKIDDVKLLKMSLKKAESMPQKATVCNKLRDRITELSTR